MCVTEPAGTPNSYGSRDYKGAAKMSHVHNWNSAPAVNLVVDLEEAVGEESVLAALAL